VLDVVSYLLFSLKLRYFTVVKVSVEFDQLHFNQFPYSGAPYDRFLSNAFKCCFRLAGVLLKLCRLILGCAKKKIICSVILWELEYSRIY